MSITAHSTLPMLEKDSPRYQLAGFDEGTLPQETQGHSGKWTGPEAPQRWQSSGPLVPSESTPQRVCPARPHSSREAAGPHGPGPHRRCLWANPAGSTPLGKWPGHGAKSGCLSNRYTWLVIHNKCNSCRLNQYMTTGSGSTKLWPNAL